MRTNRRGLTSLAFAAAALAFSGDGIRGQEVQTERDREIRVIDTTQGLATDANQTMRIQVRNDLMPAGSVVVSLVSLTRPELVLGAVLSNEALEFLIDTRRFGGGFQLIATGSMAGTQVSRRIDVANRSRVKWNLGTGLVRVERLDDGKAAG